GEDHAGDDGPVPVRAAGREWRLSPGVFWQVHPALPDVLAQVVGEWANAPRGGTAWDLYGGVGLFAAVLAEQVGRDGSVTVVESAQAAVDDGRAALADLPQVGWRVGRVEKVLAGLPGEPDVVVADPPRKGLGRAVVEALAAHGPAQVVYVACDPAALARDVAFFAGHGYTLGPLRAFDAFPMTHHMECVALLSGPTVTSSTRPATVVISRGARRPSALIRSRRCRRVPAPLGASTSAQLIRTGAPARRSRVDRCTSARGGSSTATSNVAAGPPQSGMTSPTARRCHRGSTCRNPRRSRGMATSTHRGKYHPARRFPSCTIHGHTRSGGAA